uniref:ABC transporter domain-containing protein n=1 Tax=Pyrodinium bahamense TaxID=73915 RepID=A0A7S0ALK6_9DINO
MGNSTPQFGGILYSADRVTIFPNTSATFAVPTLFNLHFSAALAANTRGAKRARLAVPPDRLEVSSQPFEATARERQFIAGFSAIVMAVVVLSAYSYIATGIASYIVMEKETDVKHQLMVSGSSRMAYWLSNFAFDSIFGLFSCVSTLAVLAIFGSGYWCTIPNIYATVTLLLLFTPAVSVFAYFWSFFFNTSGGALTGVLLIGLLLGSFGLEISNALLLFEKTRYWGYVLLWVVRAILPAACVGNGLMYLALHKDISEALDMGPFAGFLFGTEYCPRMGASAACIVNAGDDCLMLIFDTIGYVILAWIADSLVENPRTRRWLSLFSDPICPTDLKRLEDEQVCAEKERVAKLDPATQVLMADNICKVYKGRVHAVRGISFAVEPGNVFGLLGTNGAGKTTTFKMMCGQITPSSGRILVKGKNVAEDVQGVRRHIGYCPQFDALLELMTVREHLELYSKVKGLCGAAMDAEVTVRLQAHHLTEFTDSRAGQLSGGNKRKLSCAIALVGEPEVVFLDEPSAGMDPVARRQMWDVIQTMAQKRKSSAVLLTTHSMEEADALCSRIAIQCSGQLRCLGTPQQLKAWYATGLELNLRLQAPTRSEVRQLCAEWSAEPNTPCQGNSAQRLVNSFMERRRLREREAPMLGRLDTVLLGALAEWCLQEARADAVEAFLAERCGGEERVTRVEHAAGSLRYRLRGNCPGCGPLPYGELFGLFEEHRALLHLADFQISQGTLEQTFNRLAAEDLEKRGDTEDEG